MARLAATALGSGPGTATVHLCDHAEEPLARRRDDLVITLCRGEIPSIVPAGARGFAITYADPTDRAVIAAIAACSQSSGPICADPGSLALMALAERVAQSDIPLLIDGPTGTGKEVLSRFVHASSARRDGRFVAVNCAAMPEAMLEALLFGHRKGAFTGASEAAEGFFRAADGGTLLLDEIAEMPLGLQAKLLRALQEGEVVPLGATMPVKVDVRVIACANRDLPTEVAEGRFRADLYYRLNVFPLSLAALRDRPEDIAPIVFAMILRHTPAGVPVAWPSRAALAKLEYHPWPGNIRELENVVRRALVLAGNGASIEASHIIFDSAARCVSTETPVFSTPAMPAIARGGTASRLSSIVRDTEAQAIIDTLDACDGHRGETARVLGISERTLRYRLASLRDAGLAPARIAR
ncbi:Fis family transcriptional regulator [Aurantiacibacter luteus]|uniref:Fis family transcriptional regulator n=1 Tax=Aurantiacibacter luteus TaxID=1581420 RepID=A0A0G9MKT1_9SPHN|nr:Fis family transcriptional regulator [Aurantiacibacter luteus]